MAITLPEFVQKWTASTRTERAAAQEHFVDLCRLLNQQTPNQADPTGNWYAFEKGTVKVGGGAGFAVLVGELRAADGAQRAGLARRDATG